MCIRYRLTSVLLVALIVTGAPETATAQSLFDLPGLPSDLVSGQAEGTRGEPARRVAVNGFPTDGLPGEWPNNRLGYSVAIAGDVNGDGYDDLIAGAYTGRAAYIYYGGPEADGVYDLKLTGNAQFGISVAAAGDVNGDGFDDVIVGDHLDDDGGLNAGAAYVYFGGETPDDVADLTLYGQAEEDQLGSSVAGAGDVNGDGYDDLIVGAWSGETTGTNTGTAYLLFGGETPDAVPDLTFAGANEGDNFGSSVAGAGDVDGDGYDDFIVGAHSDGNGKAFVFLGGETPDADADLTLNAVQGNRFGSAVAGAGDLNGDGYDDFIVGASKVNAAYVYLGGPVLDADHDLSLRGAYATSFGHSVASAGDLNADGYDDFIVGANLNDEAGTNAGAAYVYFGGATLDDVADLEMKGQAAGDEYGRSVAGGGDLDADGLPDLIVGAPFNGDFIGRVYLYSNANTGTGLASWGTVGEAASDFMGIASAYVGDFNGDGYEDLAVGAFANDTGGNDAGAAYVFFGGPGADNVPDLTLVGQAADDRFGRAISGVGDLNGDGYDDLAVGAYLNDASGDAAGAAYVFFGAAAPDSIPDLTLIGEAAGDYFGVSVSGTGDLNGDGYDDLAVGAYLNDASGDAAGAAYVFFGAAAPDSIPDLTLIGEAAGDYFGVSVSGTGDLNGDGYDDLAVGAYLNDASGDAAGAAYVFFGAATPDSIPDLTLVGQAANDNFGYSVAGAGDLNGDGYDDLAVGAYNNDAGTGAAYVFYGGPAVDAAVDLTTRGTEYPEYFGYSVALDGDFDGDGRDDLAVGAPFNSTTGTYAGAAYLFRATGPGYHPVLTALTDVPDDQGGTIEVTFGRSPQEVHGTVASYRIESSAPPAASGYAWSTAATVIAASQRVYSAEASADGTATTCYRVVAVGTDGNEWASTADCAAALDNLAPAAPTNLAAAASADGDFMITWTPSVDADVASYVVYRSTDDDCSADDTDLGSVEGAAEYEDNATDFGSDVFYCVAAVDTSDNEGAVSVAAGGDTVAPAAPTNLAAAASADGDVMLSWTASTDADVTSYAVYRSDDDTCDNTDAEAGTATGNDAAAFEDDATDFGTGTYYCIAARDGAGNESAVTDAVQASTPVANEDGTALPAAYALSGVYPNPLRSARATVRYALPEASAVRVAVYDLLGREVAVLADEQRPAGYHDERLAAAGLARGVYLVRFEARGADGAAHRFVRKLTIVD